MISVAIPCYKSSKILRNVVEEIESFFESHSDQFDYQIILVNDGSPDEGKTSRVIRELCSENSRILGIELSRNYGQSHAKLAALPFVNGDILVYMDDDGQHNPYDILKLIEAIEDGNDVAIACFNKKKHSLFKQIASDLNSHILQLAIHKPRTLVTSSFVAYSRFMIDRLAEYNSPFVSVLGYTLLHTSRITNVPLEHRRRIDGKSGYTLRKMFNLFIDGVVGFSTFPLHLLYVVSAFLLLISLIGIVATVVLICCNLDAATLLLLSGIAFVGGILSMGQAILGEYIGRISMIQNKMPLYDIRYTWNCSNQTGETPL